MRKRFAAASLVFLLILLICIISCYAYNSWRADNWDKLPQIKNSETLRKDCLNLYQQFPFKKTPADIPKDKWPVSVVNLHPLGIYRDFYGIYITTATDINNKPLFWHPGNVYQALASEGYFVQCNQTSSVPKSSFHGFDRDGVQRTPTPFNGIEEFREPGAIQ
jgi:hypothetical protein